MTSAEPAVELPNCFMEIAIGKEKAGRIEFKLYDDVVPKKSDGEVLPKDFGYLGTPFHRVIPGFMIQGGDFEHRNGTGGQSIYGSKFNDENFKKKHDKVGLLSSANCGPNTNGSQFFITTTERCEWLDGKHVVFGEVVSGMDVVRAVEKVGSKDGSVPSDKRVTVIKCGTV